MAFKDSDIKIYGQLVNGDGNLLMSPLQIAGVASDGSIYEGFQTDKNNIVSYINEKIKGVNTNVGNIKTGIKNVAVSGTLAPDQSVDITVTGNDGSVSSDKISITKNLIKHIEYTTNSSKIPSFGVPFELAKLNIINWNNTNNPMSIGITLPKNDDVGTAWEKSNTAINYKQSVTSAINTAKSEANNYTNTQINAKLGKVYKPQGNATLTTIVTINPKNSIGNVWNMTEEFRIDGKIYPAYTNIVIVDRENLPETLQYNAGTKAHPGKGFSGEVVDALGGMFDQTAIQNEIDTKFNKSIVAINAPTIAPSFTPQLEGDITQTITYTLGNGTPGTFNITLHNEGIPVAGTDELGLVSIGRNVEIDGEGCINVPTADSTGNIGLVKSDSSSSISISGKGELDIKLATDSGITKSSTGELSIPKNTFTAGTGIKITKTGNDFSIGFSTTYTVNYASPTGKPLYYNTNTNAFYITSDNNVTLENIGTGKELKISLNMASIKTGLGLSSKADVSTVKDLTSRVEALESLLSLG